MNELIREHRWLPLIAVAIGSIVRALKDGRIVVPRQYRSALALGLGLAAGVVEALAAGRVWRDALLEGLVAATLAIVGHTLGIEWARGGKEIGA